MAGQSVIIDSLEASATRFTTSFHGLTQAQFHFKARPEKWSIAETAEHVTLSETGSGRLIRGRLIREAPPPDLLAATVGAEARMEASLGTRNGNFPAPEIVLPTGRWSTPEEVARAFEESRRATIQFLSTTVLDLTQYAAPHPALGPLNGHQWALFLVLHANRHVEQIEESKLASGYPG